MTDTYHTETICPASGSTATCQCEDVWVYPDGGDPWCDLSCKGEATRLYVAVTEDGLRDVVAAVGFLYGHALSEDLYDRLAAAPADDLKRLADLVVLRAETNEDQVSS